MTVAYNLLIGLALGFSLTVPPGPMNALIASVTTRSLRAGVLTGCGAMTADLVLGGLVFALDATVDLRAFLEPVYVVGSGVMLWLAVRLFARRGEPPVPRGDVRTLSTALAVGLTNPFQLLWWLTAGVAFAYLGGAALLVGLFGAIAAWVVSFPLALHVGNRRFPWVQTAVVYVSGGILLAFVAYFAWLAVEFR